jgi:hypothetical protein
MEWQNSTNCAKELSSFNSCIDQEKNRYQKMTTKPPIYEYIQNRIVDKRKPPMIEMYRDEVSQRRLDMINQERLDNMNKLSEENKRIAV